MRIKMALKWQAALVVLMLAALTLGAAGGAMSGQAEPTEEDHFATFTASNNEYIRNVAAPPLSPLPAPYRQAIQNRAATTLVSVPSLGKRQIRQI